MENSCCNCGEGRRGGLGVNCPLLFCVVTMLFWFLWGEFLVWLGVFADMNEGCVMNQNFLS